MVDRVIRVIVDPSGARAGLRTVQQETRRTTAGLGDLRTAATAVIAALGVRELARYADTFTLINNRLRLVTDSSAELTRIQEELLNLANETRSPLEATAELFSRVARSTSELGISQQETLDLTRAVNQAIQISGATAAEAGAGVIQFAQGLASGALRGDELRSVLEQTPRLAQALAEGLNVGIGELRELGSEGELTAERVIGALQRTAPQLAAEFATLTPTIESSFTVLNNEVLNFVGQVDSALGVSASFGRTIQDVAGAVRNVTDDVVLFGLALKTSISERFAEIASLVGTFDERFDQFSNTLAGTFATIIGDEETAALLAQQRVTIDRELSQAEREAETRLEDIRARLRENAQRDVIEFITGGGADDVDLTEQSEKKAQADRDAADAAEKTQTSAVKLLEALRDQATELRLTRELGDDAAQAIRELEIQELAVAGASAETVTALKEANAELVRQQELADAADLTAEREAFVESLQQEIALLRLTNEEREVQEALIRSNVAAGTEQADQIRTLIEQIQELRGEQEEAFSFTETIAEETSRAIRGVIRESFTGDLDEIQAEFAQFLSNLGQELLTSLFLQLLTDTFTNLGGGGGPFAGAFGALGQALGGTGRQFGGFVDAGEPFIGNEGIGRRPEVFIPREAGRISPVEQLGSEQTVIIVNEQDPSALISALNTRQGARVQRNFVQSNRRQIQRELGVR